MVSIILFSLHCMTVVLSSIRMNLFGSLRTSIVRLLLVIPAILAAFVCSAPSAQADSVVTIVNVDANLNGLASPVTVQLTAGSYSVAPIYGSPGSYTAWHASPGWGVTYNLLLPGSTTWQRFATTDSFASPSVAFANGGGTTFRLSSEGAVSFAINSTGLLNVSGGLSFQVRPNPWPVSPGEWVVDVDAYSGSHQVELSLGRGSYTVTPIDMLHGGAFTSWYTGSGWSSVYYVESPSGKKWGGGSGPGNGYGSADGAFAHTSDNASATTFTLLSPGVVYFGIQDNGYGDNGGGLSFRVTAVPLPPSVLLLAPGLAGLAVIRKRFRKA
jgi:hypothetical protein